MKYWLSSLVLVFSFSLQAEDSAQEIFQSQAIKNQCQKTVVPMRNFNGFRTRFSVTEVFRDEMETTLYFSRQISKTHSKIFRFNSAKDYEAIEIPGKVSDLVATDDELFALTNEHIKAFDRQTLAFLWEAKTHKKNRPLKKYENARGMTHWKNLLIIAHGTQDLVFFDYTRQKIVDHLELNVPQEPGHESMASDIDTLGDQAVVVLDETTLSDRHRGFEGFAFINLPRREMMWYKSINTAREGLAFPQVNWEGDHLFVNNLGLLFKYSVSDIQDSRYAVPSVRIWDYPYKGSVSGRPYFAENHVLSCFQEVVIPRQGTPQSEGRSIILERDEYNL